eukprot:5401323-Prymnesium_polylepis.1
MSLQVPRKVLMTDLSSCELQRWQRNHGAECARRHRAAQEEEDAVEDTGMDADYMRKMRFKCACVPTLLEFVYGDKKV